MINLLSKVREELRKNSLDAALISSISNIIYLTKYSGFCFSKEEREAFLFITKKFQYVLTDGRYSQAVKTLIPNFKLIETSYKLSVTNALKNLAEKHKIKKIGFEGHDITHLEHIKLTKTLGKISHVDLGSLRIIKTSEEISKIKNACKMGDEAFTYILKKIRLAISEKEIAYEIELFIKRQGGDISFPPIVAFGKNPALPHHMSGNDKLRSNQIILLDFGVKLNSYCSDMTRTVFFGSANAELTKMYDTVLESQSRAINYLKSSIINHKSISAKNVDKIARDHITSKGYPSIPHSLGHGIGLEVHEAPSLSLNSKDTLKEGMVFSIEPGIYIPNFGGIRIEDLVVLTKNGPKLLTHSPKNLIEL
jgi:Xaa-Pro aminopeptidase